GLEFEGHEPVVIALDGQPVTPHKAEGGRVVLGPAMRADIILDMTGPVARRFPVADRFYRRMEYTLMELAYDDTALRDRTPDWPMALPANPLAEPDMANSIRHEVSFNGGMMGRA